MFTYARREPTDLAVILSNASIRWPSTFRRRSDVRRCSDGVDSDVVDSDSRATWQSWVLGGHGQPTHFRTLGYVVTSNIVHCHIDIDYRG